MAVIIEESLCFAAAKKDHSSIFPENSSDLPDLFTFFTQVIIKICGGISPLTRLVVELEPKYGPQGRTLREWVISEMGIGEHSLRLDEGLFECRLHRRLFV